MSNKTLCFIGAGNMTSSIINGLVASGYPAKYITATNPSMPKLQQLQQKLNINISQDNHLAAKQSDVIILAVKPQLMEQVCNALSDIDLTGKLVLTIAAGIEAHRYESYFKQPITLVRTMPNTPTQIGAGMTGLYASAAVSESDRALSEQIMASGGETLWVDNEQDLNQVIALAGSSPAYFFLFMEAMIDNAKLNGIEESKARAMAQQAALGAAQMMIENQDLSPAQLRANVTSKGGTTAQAIQTFEQGELRTLVKQAMDNCVKRAESMAKEF